MYIPQQPRCPTLQAFFSPHLSFLILLSDPFPKSQRLTVKQLPSSFLENLPYLHFFFPAVLPASLYDNIYRLRISVCLAPHQNSPMNSRLLSKKCLCNLSTWISLTNITNLTIPTKFLNSVPTAAPNIPFLV